MLRYRKIDPTAPDLVAPTDGNAGYDLRANEDIILRGGKYTSVSTGIAVEIPHGYVGLIRGRSGMAFKANTISFDGTIDSNYRGEIKLLLKLERPNTNLYNIRRGDRVAQLVIVPYFAEQTELVDTLTETNRGNLGFGSSGR